MWIQLEPGADASEVRAQLQALGQWTTKLTGTDGTVGFQVAPHSQPIPKGRILAIEGVTDVASANSPHPLVDQQAKGQVVVSGRHFGGDRPILMAGPCSVESEAQIHQSAAMVAAAGASFLRGGAFKPRTSPYAYRGAGPEGLVWMRQAADAHGLGVITEVMSERDVELVARYADIMQIGSRNMQNYALLDAVGRAGMPVMLKRGMHGYVEEWLLAGEHLMHAGAKAVIFCERGIRSFDNVARNTLDLTAVALLKHVHGQVVIADPSHAAGRVDLIPALSRAALAAGADGLILEAHPNPAQARSDGPQSLVGHQLQSIARDMGLPPVHSEAHARL